MANNKITLSELISRNKAGSAIRLLSLHGISPAKDEQTLKFQIDREIIKQGEPFLKELALIHPHRDLILSSVEEEVEEEKPEEKKSQCGGCSHFDSVKEKVKEEKKPEQPVHQMQPNYANEVLIKGAVIGLIGTILGIAIFKRA